MREDHTAERIKIIEAIQDEETAFSRKVGMRLSIHLMLYPRITENLATLLRRQQNSQDHSPDAVQFRRQVLMFRRNLFPPSLGIASVV